MSALSSVRIGGIDYAVYTVPDLHTVHDDGEVEPDNGRLFYNKATIELSDDIAPDVLPVALWHEALHALLYQAGIVEHDETIVHALAYGIVQVMRDNQLLVTMTTEERGGERWVSGA